MLVAPSVGRGRRQARTVGEFSDDSSSRPATTSHRAAAATMAESQPGSTTSSPSQMARRSARAAAAPMLRAWLTPGRRSARTTRRWGRRSDHACTTSTVASRDPLSAATTSQGPAKSCAASAASCSATVLATSRTGSTTVTCGAGPDTKPVRYAPFARVVPREGAVPADVVVIGLDAAEATLLQRWGAAGVLPTFGGLLRDGATASLANSLETLPGAIWPEL